MAFMRDGHAVFVLLGLLIISGCVGTATGQKDPPSAGEIKTPIKTVGEVHRAVLTIDGMTCPSCAYAAEQALLRREGVIEAEVSYQKKQGIVTYDSGKIGINEIVKAVRPYTATLLKDEEREMVS